MPSLMLVALDNIQVGQFLSDYTFDKWYWDVMFYYSVIQMLPHTAAVFGSGLLFLIE